MTYQIPFLDLTRQFDSLGDGLLAAFETVGRSQSYILGPELAAFEAEFAAYQGLAHAVGVGNGTDAIAMTLRALGIGEGDEVLTCANPFLACTSSIVLAGAVPVFVDVAADFNIDPDRIEAAITPRTRAILAIHLHGRPLRIERIMEIAERRNLLVVEDCAQAVGARAGGVRLGGRGVAGCFSFHPNKILSCMGDGGAVVTNDAALAQRIREMRNHGLRGGRFIGWGYNSRLSELAAAMLRVALPHVDGWIERRRAVAHRYRNELAPFFAFPDDGEKEGAGRYCVYSNFVGEHPSREALGKHLATAGVETRVFYRVPIHLHEGAVALGWEKGSLPETERQAERIIALPVHQFLTDEEVGCVIDAVREFQAKAA